MQGRDTLTRFLDAQGYMYDRALKRDKSWKKA